MKKVVLRVHPLTRAVLLSEHGCTEPITLGPNHLIFPLLTSAPLQEFANVNRAIPFLTDTVVVTVHPGVAANLFQRPYHAGAALFRLHKDQMCRYAQVCVRRGGDAWASIQEWLYCHGVDEDAYSMETAYKCWQRWNWLIQKKNPVFFGRIRSKAAVKPAKKVAHIQSRISLPECELECALERFLITLNNAMRRTPKRFPAHARAWFYREIGGLSEREAAALLGRPRASIGYGYRSMQNWIDTNRKVRLAIEQTVGLPRCA